MALWAVPRRRGGSAGGWRIDTAPYPGDAAALGEIGQIDADVVVSLMAAPGLAECRKDVVDGHLGAGRIQDCDDRVGSRCESARGTADRYVQRLRCARSVLRAELAVRVR
jgi:hypothetical protein